MAGNTGTKLIRSGKIVTKIKAWEANVARLREYQEEYQSIGARHTADLVGERAETIEWCIQELRDLLPFLGEGEA